MPLTVNRGNMMHVIYLLKNIFCISGVNECFSSPCQNAGTCIDGINEYNCICITGYIGTHCEGNLIFGHLWIDNVMKNNCLKDLY